MSSDSELRIACAEIREALSHDIVSLAELLWFVRGASGPVEVDEAVIKVLQILLASGVEIGCAVNSSGNYVRFVAWRGSVESRIERLAKEMANNGRDSGFVAWISTKVDRYED